MVPDRELWNKIMARSVHAGEKWGSPQGTAHPFPAGKQGLQCNESTPGDLVSGCRHCCARPYFLLWDVVRLQECP